MLAKVCSRLASQQTFSVVKHTFLFLFYFNKRYVLSICSSQQPLQIICLAGVTAVPKDILADRGSNLLLHTVLHGFKP